MSEEEEEEEEGDRGRKMATEMEAQKKWGFIVFSARGLREKVNAMTARQKEERKAQSDWGMPGLFVL